MSFRPISGANYDFVIRQSAYDACGRMAFEETANGQRRIDYTYDAAGRITRQTISAIVVNHVTSNRVATEVFDSVGNVLTRTVTQGSRVDETRYLYDAANRVIRETVEAGTTDLVTDFLRDQSGNVTRVINPAGGHTSPNTTSESPVAGAEPA